MSFTDHSEVWNGRPATPISVQFDTENHQDINQYNWDFQSPNPQPEITSTFFDQQLFNPNQPNLLDDTSITNLIPQPQRQRTQSDLIRAFTTAMLSTTHTHLGIAMATHLEALVASNLSLLHNSTLTNLTLQTLGNPTVLSDPLSRLALLPHVSPGWYTESQLFPFAGVLPHPTDDFNPERPSVATSAAALQYLGVVQEQLDQHQSTFYIETFVDIPRHVVPDEVVRLVTEEAIFVAGPAFEADFRSAWVVYGGPLAMRSERDVMWWSDLLVQVNDGGRPLGSLGVLCGWCLGGSGMGERLGTCWALCVFRAGGQDWEWRYFLILRGERPFAVSFGSVAELLRALPFLRRPEGLREEIWSVPEEVRTGMEVHDMG